MKFAKESTSIQWIRTAKWLVCETVSPVSETSVSWLHHVPASLQFSELKRLKIGASEQNAVHVETTIEEGR
jgi:hypothetical protein